MTSVFIAYASGNDYHRDIINEACSEASTPQRSVRAWSGMDASGHPIASAVEGWIDEADSFIGDVSVVNDNVTYELGYALGQGKPIRLMRSTHFDFAPIKSVGLLDTLIHDSYDLKLRLVSILRKVDKTPHWPKASRNVDQPLFVLQPPTPTDQALRATSGIKKIARMRFRNFNPNEISRLTASELYEQVTSSIGVVSLWDGAETAESRRNNQRACFMFGVARGLGIPALLIAHTNLRLPLDLEDQANRWRSLDDIDKLIYDFRNNVADRQNEAVRERPKRQKSLLESMNCGEPVAENEASSLADVFLETDAFQRTLEGTANVLVGRKGSGKTAIFLQARDICRSDKQNIVIDLIPDGYQLVKMKEFILDQLGRGARKEVIAAFWEYILWLEIAYKIIEKDEQRSLRDTRLTDGFKRLEKLFLDRVDTGEGDFSERLKRLSANIIRRFEDANLTTDEKLSLNSSKVVEIIYAQDVRGLREGVLDYLRLKGFVLFLLDNLDRFWTPGGFDEDDALIVVGLTESMQEVTRKFSRKGLDFRWAIFIRSDVYEFLVRGMADYGKLGVQSLEWSDRGALSELFDQRLSSSLHGVNVDWKVAWRSASVQTVCGRPTIEFLIDGSMMRPRYLIRLFETARRRAITFNRAMIEEGDYLAALNELGWQVIEDLDREVIDIVPGGSEFLFELIEQSEGLTPDKFRYFCGRRMSKPEDIERLLDVMIWNGSIGITENGWNKFIFDCGYKRQYISSRIKADPSRSLVLHPTLLAAID